MLVDGRRTEGLPEQEYDLVIVGAGPAGITLAHELRGTGLRIALLESGGEEYDDSAQALNEGTIEGNDDEYDLAFSRLRYLGGTSNHWGGHCTPLDAIDFERAWNGMTGWPMSRASLDPYYERAHAYCDLGAYRYAFADLAPGDPDLRLLPDTPGIETAVLRQSPPTRFGEKYRDALAASETIHVWLWTTAVRVTTAPEAVEIVDTRTLEGVTRRFTARAVVLAAGAIEATRLMLWSNQQNGTAAGDAGGLLGKCYMDHPSGGAAFLHFDRRVGDKIYWADIDTYADGGVPLHFALRLSDARQRETGLPNGHFLVFPFADDEAAQTRKRRADLGMRSLKSVVKWAIGRDVGARFDPGREYCNVIDSADEMIAAPIERLRGGGYGRVLLKYEAEQRPDRDNGLRLDAGARDAVGVPAPILQWAPSADDMEAVRQSAIEIGRMAGAAGLGRIELEDYGDDPYWGTTTAWHQLGTMRMADSPQAGVTDADGRVHGAGALYVASGATFPSVGRANPTLTIVALTLRLADHLKGRLAA